MRRLFLVLAKLVGLLQIYWALAYFIQIGYIISMMIRSEPSPVGQILFGLIGTFLYIIISFGMAWLLLVQTEWLADKLRISDNGEVGELKEEYILRAGIKLIGVYVTVFAIPSLVSSMFGSRIFSAGQFSLDFWTKIIPAVLQVGLGAYLLLKSGHVLDMITEKQDPDRN